MKNPKDLKRWESQARSFFGDEFWNDILSVMPGAEAAPAQHTAQQTTQERETKPHTGASAVRSSKPQPAVDVFRTEKLLLVQIELPGLRSVEAVDIYLQGGELVVTGNISRRFSREQTLLAERFVGDFKRMVPLPEPVDEENIEARYVNGILEIVLPRLKRRGEPKKRIRIARDSDDFEN
ncbi:Hsp20/alpha crystallin family protein [Tumebacillus permanentifrigoris]|uniref:HSP20 family molecular chaperone IbpA n=1 Tax=Tumebacillus permanentifrigoris TaxID=378543 RepID=A0A316D784_9BACL|nr:Hsp20/alpha crystallin family protein [Tumebacillus permanentifrigoris]PWK08467.1 HSP20 family molecular chaperone IbpA [Tumebacillus permanentifrigoris]